MHFDDSVKKTQNSAFSGREKVALLNEEFITAQSPPITTPRTAEYPGLVFNGWNVVDTGNKFTLQSGRLTWFLGNNANFDPSLVGNALVARQAGRTLITDWQGQATSIDQFGWTNTITTTVANIGPGRSGVILSNATAINYAYFNGTSGVLLAITGTGVIAAATDYKFAVTQLAQGFACFVKGGAFTDWSLLWIDTINASTPLAPLITQTANAAGSIANVWIGDIPSISSLEGMASLWIPSPVTATNYVGNADGITHLTVTAPASLTGTTATGVELRYRYQDASNYWTAYFRENGQFRVDSVVGGVATNQVSAAGIVAANDVITIKLNINGPKHNAFTSTLVTDGKRGSEVNLSHVDTISTVRPIVAAGWAISNLRSWPKNSHAYNALG